MGFSILAAAPPKNADLQCYRAPEPLSLVRDLAAEPPQPLWSGTGSSPPSTLVRDWKQGPPSGPGSSSSRPPSLLLSAPGMKGDTGLVSSLLAEPVWLTWKLTLLFSAPKCLHHSLFSSSGSARIKGQSSTESSCLFFVDCILSSGVKKKYPPVFSQLTAGRYLL